jgi:hypothetical protein
MPLGAACPRCKEPRTRFVERGMARKTVRRDVRLVGRPRCSLLAISVCLAVGLLLVTAQAGVAISGFATDGPAVRAQYPDSAAAQRPEAQAAISTLRDVARTTPRPARDRKTAARERSAMRAIVREASTAAAKGASLGTRESGSVLLLAAFAVAGLAGLLRWRRGVGEA